MARSSPLHLWFLPLLVTALLFLAAPTLAQNGNGGNGNGGQVEPNFDFYPQNAHTCLYESSNSTDCDRPNFDALNECLCTNTRNFVTNAARCLGEEGADNLDEIYNTFSQACEDSDTPTNVRREEFLGAAERGASATTSGGPSSTATDEPTNTSSPPEETSSSDDGGGGGLGTGATAGIAVGAAVAGMAIMGAIGFWLFRRYRKRHAAESSPMLPNSEAEHGTPMYTAASPAFTDDRKSPHPMAPSTVSPPTYSGAWGTPAQAYGGQHAPAELAPEVARGQAMEMEGSTHFNVPVEMPGSQPGFTSQHR